VAGTQLRIHDDAFVHRQSNRLGQRGVRLNPDPGDDTGNQQFLAARGFQRELLALNAPGPQPSPLSEPPPIMR
jgi:hypothetical protein